ncbi:hypothetical protein JL721_6297 [Aureococcus anophagefferens]|nr:hypothetical protein JL721_6297 [Aureococcus anophagefferens]
MGKNKRSDKLKGAGDKRHKGANLSDEDLDEKQTASIQEMAKAQRGEEARREADDLAACASRVAFDVEEVSDDDDDDDYLDGDEGDDVDESAFDIGPAPAFAGVIMEKIAEKEAGADAMDDDVEDNTLPERVVEAYSGMIPLLERYRCGKLPKAFKVIPALERWEDVLWLVRPDLWSAHCVEAATKVFASNLDPKRARVFYNEVLLERCRDDITVNKKLNYHLYQALHKALFKPAPWFKGILLPLVQDRDCAARRSSWSVLAKASVPAAHAAVVLLKLADMAYSGAQSVFLIVLLNKKPPRRGVVGRRESFLKFESDEAELPVLWHQSLLTFVQRYRADLDDATSASLLKLLKAHKHHTITHEIRRELVAGHKSRH